MLPNSNLNPPDSATYTASNLEAYLDLVCAGMPAEIPAEALADIRREMRDHLMATVAACEELGYQLEESVELALTQFGDPRMVSEHWQRELQATLPQTTHAAIWPSLKQAVAISAAAAAIEPFLSALHIAQAISNPEPAQRLVVVVALLGLPCLSGTMIGLRMRRYPVLFTLLSYLLTTPIIGLGLVAVNMIMNHVLIWGVGWEAIRDVSPAWIPISLLCAGAGSLGRRIKIRVSPVIRPT